MMLMILMFASCPTMCLSGHECWGSDCADEESMLLQGRYRLTTTMLAEKTKQTNLPNGGSVPRDDGTHKHGANVFFEVAAGGRKGHFKQKTRHHRGQGHDRNRVADKRVTENDLAHARGQIQNVSDAVGKALATKYKGHSTIDDRRLVQMWKRTFTFTAGKTWRIFPEDGTVFTSTGDLPQMWLRDSSVQLFPYIEVAAKSGPDSPIRRVLRSAMQRQVRFILDDAYGSSFFLEHGKDVKQGPNKNQCPRSKTCRNCECSECAPPCGKYTHQRDFELDSLLFPILLHYKFWRATSETSHFSSEFSHLAQVGRI